MDPARYSPYSRSSRFSLSALLLALALPAWSQIVSTSPIPNGLTPSLPSTPNVGPSYNTQPPVGSIGIGGTTTQVVPNSANPSGGSSLSTSGGSITTYGGVGTTSMPGIPSSVTSANVPGYTPPGSTPLPGYSAPPGTMTFPATGGTSTPGVPAINGSLGGSDSGLNGSLGGASGSSGLGTTGTGTGGVR